MKNMINKKSEAQKQNIPKKHGEFVVVVHKWWPCVAVFGLLVF